MYVGSSDSKLYALVNGSSSTTPYGGLDFSLYVIILFSGASAVTLLCICLLFSQGLLLPSGDTIGKEASKLREALLHGAELFSFSSADSAESRTVFATNPMVAAKAASPGDVGHRSGTGAGGGGGGGGGGRALSTDEEEASRPLLASDGVTEPPPVRLLWAR